MRKIVLILSLAVLVILLACLITNVLKPAIPFKLELIDSNRNKGKVIDALYDHSFRMNPKPVVIDGNKLTIYKDCSLKKSLNTIDLGGDVLDYCIRNTPLSTGKAYSTVLSFICLNTDKTKTLVTITFSEDDRDKSYSKYSIFRFKTELDKVVSFSFSDDDGISVLCESKSLLVYGIFNLKNMSEYTGAFKTKTSLHRYIVYEINSTLVGYDGMNLCFYKFDSKSLTEISKYPTGYKGTPSDLNFNSVVENYYDFFTYKEYLGIFDSSYLHIFYLDSNIFVQHIKLDDVQQSAHYSLYNTKDGLYYFYIRPEPGDDRILCISKFITNEKYDVFLNIDALSDKYIVGSYKNDIQSIYQISDLGKDSNALVFNKYSDIDERLEHVLVDYDKFESFFYTSNKIYKFNFGKSPDSDFYSSVVKRVPIPAKWVDLKNLP
jgi:hypothetical protein